MATKKKPKSKKPVRKAAKRRIVRKVVPVAKALPPVGLPKLGEVFPGQGGVFAGVIRDEDGTQRALVVPTDASCSFDGAWGEYGKTVKGADSPSDGRANTEAMAAAGSAIAKKALALSVEGHADLYIPSRREIAICEANVAHLFDKTWHWSSSQSSSHFAWLQGFTSGYVSYFSKDFKHRVRAVRSLVIQ
jgi:hypothetical protein